MNKIQKKIVEDALDYEDYLSEWESRFINDMAEKPESFQPSEKQNEILNKICNKVNEI